MLSKAGLVLLIIYALCLVPLNAKYFDGKIQLQYDLGLERPGFQVAIHSNDEGRVCDGSVISSSAILTAARCFYNSKTSEFRNAKDIYITFDAINHKNSSIDKQSIDATNFVYPGSFDIETMKDDVAILLLDTQIPNDLIPISNLNSMQITDKSQADHTSYVFNKNIVEQSNIETTKNSDSPLIGVLCFLAFTIYAATRTPSRISD